MRKRIALVLLAAIAACFLAWGASLAAIAPVSPEQAVPAPGRPSEEVPALTGCVVAGTLQCSEYGSRFKDTLMLVLADGDERYSSSISDTDGSFALPVPCGRSFELLVQFRDRSMSLGRIELPEGREGAAYTLEMRHTGSYLELVRDVRNGINEDDIIYRLTEPQE